MLVFTTGRTQCIVETRLSLVVLETAFYNMERDLEYVPSGKDEEPERGKV